jgi:hypothetical protein
LGHEEPVNRFDLNSIRAEKDQDMKQIVLALTVVISLAAISGTAYAAEQGYGGFEDFLLETPFNGIQ